MDNTFNIVTNLIIFVPLIVIFSLLPFLTRKDIMFGVTIPPVEWQNDYFKSLRKTYVWLCASIGTVLTAASVVSSAMLEENVAVVLMQVILWTTIIGYFLLYLYFWKKTKRYKANANWKMTAKNIAIADTSTDYTSRSLSLVWFLLYIVVIAITFLGAVRLYDLAPDMIPMRVDMQGNPLVYAPKSMNLIYQIIGMQVFLGAMFYGITILTRRAKKVIDPANPEKSSTQNDEMKYRWSIFLFITGLFMLLIFAQIIGAMFVTMPVWISLYFPMIVVLIILVYAIVLSIKTGQSGNRIKSTDDKNLGKEITRDDDSLWKLGVLYFNKEDPAVFVEKRFGAGWTTNWAKWQSWLMLAGIVAIVAVSFVLGM